MRVAVKWLKSPRQSYGIPRAPGTFSSLDAALAKKIRAEAPGLFESPELDELEKEKPPIVKDTMARRPRIRPVTREKES